MALPRCGVKDNVGFELGRRAKRYTLQGKQMSNCKQSGAHKNKCVVRKNSSAVGISLHYVKIHKPVFFL